MRAIGIFLLATLALSSTAIATSFEEPAAIEGEISIQAVGDIFIIFPASGDAMIDFDGEARHLQQRVYATPAGGSNGNREVLSSKEFDGNLTGKLGTDSSLQFSGNWELYGSSEMTIWNDDSQCDWRRIRFAGAECSSLGTAWSSFEVQNLVLNFESVEATFTETTWQDSLPDSKREEQSVASPVGTSKIVDLFYNHLTGTTKGSIIAPRALIVTSFEALQVDGSIELANYNDPAKATPNLIAEGQFSFSNLTFQNGRFEADMSGEVEAARLDNEIIAADSLGWAVSIAGSAAATFIVWKLVSSGLIAGFTRLSMEDALEHPKRRKVYDYILMAPGATFREVVRETGYATGTTRHHLTILKRSKAVMEHKYLQTLRYYENHGRYNESWDAIALLREEPLSQLHSWLTANPRCNQKAILAAMGEFGWSRSTAQHRLSRLVDGGLVSMRPQGRMNMYEAHPLVRRST